MLPVQLDNLQCGEVIVWAALELLPEGVPELMRTIPGFELSFR